MLRSITLAIGLLAGATYLIIAVVPDAQGLPSPTPAPAISTTPDWDVLVAATYKQELIQAQSDSRLFDYTLENGLEPGNARVHFLVPRDYSPTLGSNASPFWAGGHNLWQAETKYATESYHLPPIFQAPSARVSLWALFDARIIASATAQQNGPEYSVFISFNQGQIDWLKKYRSHHEDTGRDWFGRSNPTPTELLAVVVSDNVAYLPFSVSSIIDDNLVNVPIEVARDLPQAEATQLAGLLKP